MTIKEIEAIPLVISKEENTAYFDIKDGKLTVDVTGDMAESAKVFFDLVSEIKYGIRKCEHCKYHENCSIQYYAVIHFAKDPNNFRCEAWESK